MPADGAHGDTRIEWPPQGASPTAPLIESRQRDEPPAVQPADDADLLGWIGIADEPASESSPGETWQPPPADWMQIVNGSASATVMPAATAIAATSAAVSPTPTRPGALVPAQQRGMRAWSGRMRWSFVISIVLLAGVVAGSLLIAQSVSASSRAAQELAAAVGDLTAAEAVATESDVALADAIIMYDETADLAQATVESAGPSLAAVAGMVAEAVLAASDAALADLVAQLAVEATVEPPQLYERREVDLDDVAAIAVATGAAEAHASAVSALADEVRIAQVALQEKLAAQRAAQLTLGASLPETAEVIGAENPDADQSVRDDVVAAAETVGTAQTAGGSGDAELLAYAGAVTALRDDQARAEAAQPPRPSNPAPLPQPTTDPAPEPTAPAPQPTTPAPVPTDPPPDPGPTDPPPPVEP